MAGAQLVKASVTLWQVSEARPLSALELALQPDEITGHNWWQLFRRTNNGDNQFHASVTIRSTMAPTPKVMCGRGTLAVCTHHWRRQVFTSRQLQAPKHLHARVTSPLGTGSSNYPTTGSSNLKSPQSYANLLAEPTLKF